MNDKNDNRTEANMARKLIMTNPVPLQFIEHYNPKSRSKKNTLIKQLATMKEIPVICLGDGAVRLIGDNPVYLKFDPKTGNWATTIDKTPITLGQGHLEVA